MNANGSVTCTSECVYLIQVRESCFAWQVKEAAVVMLVLLNFDNNEGCVHINGIFATGRPWLPMAREDQLPGKAELFALMTQQHAAPCQTSAVSAHDCRHELASLAPTPMLHQIVHFVPIWLLKSQIVGAAKQVLHFCRRVAAFWQWAASSKAWSHAEAV